jgi:anti-sigma factor RsiW
MRYADGELSPEERRTVDVELSRQPDLKATVSGIEQIGDLVRQHADQVGASFSVIDDVWARIDTATGEKPSRMALRTFPSARWTLLGAGLAAAAAVALLVGRQGPEPSRRSSTETIGTADATGAASLATPAGADPEDATGASIETLDPGPGGATLFVVQAGAIATPVVWLLDEADRKHDRITPL